MYLKNDQQVNFLNNFKLINKSTYDERMLMNEMNEIKKK